MLVRRLNVDDAGEYLAIRREMLVDSPLSFGSSPEDDRFQSEADVRAALARPAAEYAIVGAFDGDRLVGAAGVHREGRAKTRHVASIWGVYVRPAWRGRGLGKAVSSAAVEVARGWEGVRWVQLAASAAAPAALATYRSLGFVAWGTEPGALLLDGREYDEVYMRLRL
jgi:GNAT superfamily N-acetyltransferase